MLYLDLTLRDLQCGCAQPYIIGRRGTSGVLTVRLDYSDWVRAYGGGTITLMVKPYGAGAAYPVTLDDDHGLAAWPVSNSDTQTAGVGQAEFVFHPDASTVDKSAVFSFAVLPDIGPAMSEPPDAYEDWVSRLEGLGAETLQNAQDAAESASEARGYAEAAETAKNAAQDAQEAAEVAKTTAQTAAAAVTGAAAAAEQSAEAADLSKRAAAASEMNATESAGQAASSATAAAGSAHNASLSETAAHDYAEAAEGSAASASTSAASAASAASTAIQQINAAGAAQVQAVEGKGEEVLNSIPPDYSALVSDVEAIETELDGVATETTAQQTLAAEDDGAFWLGRVLMVMDGLADDLIAMVEAEIAKLPQDENGQAIAASIGEGNSWLNMLYHELEVD